MTVTVNVPAELPMQLRVDVPEPAMLAGLRVHVRPVLGETEEARVTVPVNPLTAPTVIVDNPVASVLTIRLVGLAASVKFGVPLFHNQAPALTSGVVPPTIIVLT